MYIFLSTWCPIFSILINLLFAAVLYICTEDSFPSKRLLQLINNIRHPFKNARELSYGDRILVEHIADVVSIHSIFCSCDSILLKSPNISRKD